MAVKGSVPVKPPPAAPRTRLQKKRDQLARLLKRFPERRGEGQPELLPPTTGPDAVIATIEVLAEVKEAWPWLAELAQKAPVAVRRAALQVLGRT